MVQSIHEVLLRRFAHGESVDATATENATVTETATPTKTATLASFELNRLRVARVLSIAPRAKKIVLECRYLDEPAVVMLEKSPFEPSVGHLLDAHFGDALQNAKNLFHNDIYGSYLVDLLLAGSEPDHSLHRIFMTVIHPATPKEVEKYLDRATFLVRETAQLYERVTKPYIETMAGRPGHLQWLYNFLERKAEVDRVVYEENMTSDELGFMLGKDMKWKVDKDELEEHEKHDLYITAIVRRRDLRTLRDLRPLHLPLLEAINTRGREAIARKYSLAGEELRVFIHYQPSFYHLHVHFTHVKGEHFGAQCERAHPLSIVIENLKMMPDYYQKVTLEFPLSEGAELKPQMYQ